MSDQRIAKWTRWIDGPIRANVLATHRHRYAWREVAQIIQEHGQLPPSFWWEFMADTYAVTQSVAIRRIADTHKDVASLGKLIEEIRDDAQRISRTFWLGLWSDPDHLPSAWIAEKGWTDQYAGQVGMHLDPAIPAADFDALRKAAAKVSGYVDRHVAHADASAVSAEVTVTFRELHEVIDVIGNLFGKYYNLLTAGVYVRLVPEIQGDWKAVFREPWIPPRRENR
jgi:AbiU2